MRDYGTSRFPHSGGEYKGYQEIDFMATDTLPKK